MTPMEYENFSMEALREDGFLPQDGSIITFKNFEDEEITGRVAMVRDLDGRGQDFNADIFLADGSRRTWNIRYGFTTLSKES